ncbi:hypothetical protein BCR42DRAFT_433770 [Absidia repens]|uniref:Uncharacterized protein n=1 Tax=Absidia repens TaxID=90262 RepID=A0A1X2IUF8_9FUNG|nr:hypothetical protein BCR42DRAFT_433770 [Absidia repens]
MQTQNELLQMLYLMDRHLLFFFTDEQRHLGIMEEDSQHQLAKLIKKIHQQIQQIGKYKPQGIFSIMSFSTFSSNGHSLDHGQQMIAQTFLQQKHTKQLYVKLKDIKNQYHEVIQHQQIRILENDMERYQQLQRIHGLSNRLEIYDQAYDELHHLRRALSKLRREWRLDRVQQIVSIIVASPPSPSSSLLSLSPSPLPCNMPSRQKHRTSSTNLFGFLKPWSRHSPASVLAENQANTVPLKNGTSYHHQCHLLCASREEGRQRIMQIIRDFRHVFEGNVCENEQLMHQLYARVFQQNADPMLANDIQRLYLSVRGTSPPSLTSLTPSNISPSCSWTTDTTHALFFRAQDHHLTAFDDMIHYPETVPSFISLSNGHPSPSKRRQNGIKWISNMWEKRKQQRRRQQQQPNCPITSCQYPYFQQRHQYQHLQPVSSSVTTIQQQQQAWSVCLGLLSEHLLHVGQQYYTQWLQEITQCQDRQIESFQLATETMTSAYQALQIEHGYDMLSRLCLQMESFSL